MSVPIPVGQTERDFRGRKRDRYPLALFPLLLPLQYPSWDEGGADWRNGEEGKDESGEKRAGVVAAAVTNIPGMDYGAGP